MSKRKHKLENRGVILQTPFILKIAFSILGLTHVVCPLLFFTNLTRNPYYTQIALLNIAISLCGLIWVFHIWINRQWVLPRLPTDWPLFFFLFIALIATTLSWIGHPTMRIGIGYEALRVWVFTLINCVMAFYLPLLFTRPSENEEEKFYIWTDIVLAGIWGGLWFFFHDLKGTNPAETMWDPYGFLLWLAAGGYAIYRTRRGVATGFFHLIFVVAMLASLYGILQYAGRDLIWSSVVQPYGGRPVSTFGNPNFLSSYLMLVSPLACAYGLKSEKKQRLGYLFIAVITAVGVLVTLTRSTYVGLMAAYLFLAVLLFRKEHLKYAKWFGVAAGIFVVLVLLFPKTPLSEVQSPLSRFTEIFQQRDAGVPYAPWHQRLLIWSSAWDMVQAGPLFGKGWGTFELFYPFYQGHYLLSDLFPALRTHANNAHNILLEMWAQLGILGTGTAIWLFITIFFAGWSIFRAKSETKSKLIVASLLAGLMGMIVDNFMGNVSIFFAVPAFLFWWNMGAMLNEGNVTPPQTRPVPLLGHVFLIGVVGVCLFSIGYFVKRWNQERYYFEGFKFAKAGHVQPSIKSLEKAFAWFGGEVNSNYEMGNSYARHAKDLRDKGFERESKKSNEMAERGYQAALYANPGYDEIYFNLGIVQLQLGKDDEAIRNFELAVFINPLLKGIYSPLANQYLSRQEFDKSRALFEQGVAAFPHDKDMWNNLGYTYGKLGLVDKQIEAFRRSYQTDPSFELALKNLYLSAHERGVDEPYLQIPSLIKELESHLMKSQYEKALPVAQKLIELMPYNAEAHLSLANIHFYLNHPDEAIENLKKALEIKPEFITARVNLAKIYLHQNQEAFAAAQLRRLKYIDPSHPEVKELSQQMLK